MFVHFTVSSIVQVSGVTILLCRLLLFDKQQTASNRFDIWVFANLLLCSPLFIDPSMNIFMTLSYFCLAFFVLSCRFYFVFFLNDSISNAAGLGFEGYDNQNRPKWGLASNVDVMGLEFSISLRNFLNSWNITSSLWIRRSATIIISHCLYKERFSYRGQDLHSMQSRYSS